MLLPMTYGQKCGTAGKFKKTVTVPQPVSMSEKRLKLNYIMIVGDNCGRFRRHIYSTMAHDFHVE